MLSVEDKVLGQTRLFMSALPGLLQKHRGKSIVFHEGAVRSEHDTEEQAFVVAVDAFGADAGFVVAPVEEVTATPITAAIAFCMPA